MTLKAIFRSLVLRGLALGFASLLYLTVAHVPLYAQEQSTQSSAQTAPEKSAADKSDNDKSNQSSGQSAQPEHHTGIAGELAKETRESEGEGEEENVKLKHSSMVQKLARITGLSVHGAHLLALGLNFAIIVFLAFWLGRKSLPAILRNRSESIQKALDEARRASDEANKRLAGIESRLRQMDGEIATMQASAEKEALGEEARIQKAAEDEIRKVVQAAEQEIAAAAKQARRELSSHTADLAVALARKQINVDFNTDQVLVRDFAAKLASNAPSRDNGGRDGR
ncbi:MAG: ATP synthase F0 subunit B [Terriglobales bacterium]